ncbi:hypothetical protein C4D60_Mb11t06270 [Musa balbisiana]|uniref:X8 domain-containing protein n=1 Tax=Musa balbisiana TaxID=52838 RepID=A0A4S8J4L0_MUSBA|nr:hypothetical protein C4D60_Mb11t06270 [Musa balbisiana]
MITAVPRLLSLFLILVVLTPRSVRSESSTSNISPELGVVADGAGQGKQWCIADEQTAADVLQVALDWACGAGGANCSMIQPNKPCYFPNTVKDHASYAFNSYWQKHKHQGGTCYFNAAAMVTDLNPSTYTPFHLHLPLMQALRFADRPVVNQNTLVRCMLPICQNASETLMIAMNAMALTR